MFRDIKVIKSIKFTNFKGCTNTSYMFYDCTSLEEINLSSFDTDDSITEM